MFTLASASRSKVAIERSVARMRGVSPTWCAPSHLKLVLCDDQPSYAFYLSRMKVSFIKYHSADNINYKTEVSRTVFSCPYQAYLTLLARLASNRRSSSKDTVEGWPPMAAIMRTVEPFCCIVGKYQSNRKPLWSMGSIWCGSYRIHVVYVRSIIEQQGHHRGMAVAASQ